MASFQIKDFSERLKDVAKSDKFGGVGKLGRMADIGNLSHYTKEKDPREPKAETLYKLALCEIDINWLLTGAKSTPEMEATINNIEGSQNAVGHHSIVKENTIEYSPKENELLIKVKVLEKEVEGKNEMIGFLKEQLAKQ